jgi:hypothetical protein
LIVLDPRIKFSGAIKAVADDYDLHRDVQRSKHDFDSHFLAHYSDYPPARSSRSPGPTQAGAFFALFADDDEESSAPERELEQFFELKIESFKTCPDPVQWWAGRRSQFPCLSRMARDIFAIPGM